jgi:hypothetical protein
VSRIIATAFKEFTVVNFEKFREKNLRSCNNYIGNATVKTKNQLIEMRLRSKREWKYIHVLIKQWVLTNDLFLCTNYIFK